MGRIHPTAVLCEANLRRHNTVPPILQRGHEAESSEIETETETETTTADDTVDEDSQSQTDMATSRVTYTQSTFPVLLEERGVFGVDEHEVPPAFHQIKPFLSTSRSDTADLDITTIVTKARKAPNEATFFTNAISPIVDLPTVSIDEELAAVYDAVWIERPLPSRVETIRRLAKPKPDITVGICVDASKCRAGMDVLPDSTPVACDPTLGYPCLTIEAKGLQSDTKAIIQNQHNAAIMLRGLRLLRLAAINGTTTLMDFDDRVFVLTATLTKERAGVWAHWTHVNADGQVDYRSHRVEGWEIHAARITEIALYLRNAVSFVRDQLQDWVRRDLERVATRVASQIRAGEPIAFPDC